MSAPIEIAVPGFPPASVDHAFVASATAMMAAPDVGAAGTAALADAGSILAGVLERGLGAFGAALVASVLSFRRRIPRPQTAGTGILPHDLMAAMPCGVALWNAAGELLACNLQFEAHLMWGGPDLAPGVAYTEAVKRLVRGGRPTPVREDEGSRLLELQRPDGAFLMIEERALSTGGFVTLVTDGTERHRAELRLAAVQQEQRQLARRYHEEKLRAEAASRSKTAFLAHLSHDIRTPLNHIIGFAELMRHETYGPIGDARYLNYVETIKGSGERLLTFFASILDLAELEGGQRELKHETLAVDDLLDSLHRRFKGQASRAGVRLNLGAQSGAILTGDRFCLERMLGNLVENAFRFTPAGGQVSLAAYAASDGVVLEITDTGVGMSDERLSELSQPFAFGDASLTREHGGPGLGLPIARAIAEQSGGHLAIDSRPGLGTTVAISLPLVSAAQVQAA